TISERSAQPLHRGSSSRNIYRRNFARRVRVALERRNAGGENFSLIFELVALEHAADDLDAFPHHGSGTDFLTFPLADFFHEDLRRAETQKESVTSEILHDARFHRDFDGMSRVGRNNPPAELNALGLAGDDGENCGRGAGLKGMLTPPRVRFGDPEGVEACVLAGLGHGCGFVDRLHAQLKDSDIEWNGHDGSGSVISFQLSALSSQLSVKAEPAPRRCPVKTQNPSLWIFLRPDT